MTAQDPGESKTSEPFEDPAHDRSGTTIDEAVDKAEAGTQVEGVHTPSGQAASGESRVEQMPDVEGVTEARVDGSPGGGDTPRPGPSPADIGSGGAQRIVGARISDRVSAGEQVPDGPPFDSDSAGNPEDSTGAGT